MKVFNHVLNTWLLAHALHPFVFYFYFLLINKESLEFEALLSLFIGAFIISFPSLIFSRLFFGFVLWLRIPVAGSFISWCILTLVSTFLNVILLGFLLGNNLINQSDSKFFIPSFIATFFSVLIRFIAFQELIKQHRRFEEQEHIVSSYDN